MVADEVEGRTVIALGRPPSRATVGKSETKPSELSKPSMHSPGRFWLYLLPTGALFCRTVDTGRHRPTNETL